ncbi:hypothetical protein PR202_ga06085 [Eleusine coracana subsp. coracana]|uniref:DUF6598 domain-containing protein n=1 Tax=Eleusine coracana subsp. coracana TaxID=191504 RepID=A0AAV5BV46_ELECO|nr:hypothetical protein PR202_ga06085 [Eleusine coracana subsp. coracana]
MIHKGKATSVNYNPKDPPEAYSNASISRLSEYTSMAQEVHGPEYDLSVENLDAEIVMRGTECVAPHAKPSKKSDVWSLGVLILEVLTGKFPASYLGGSGGGNNKLGRQQNADLAGWVHSVVSEERTEEVFDKDITGAMGDRGRHGQAAPVDVIARGGSAVPEFTGGSNKTFDSSTDDAGSRPIKMPELTDDDKILALHLVRCNEVTEYDPKFGWDTCTRFCRFNIAFFDLDEESGTDLAHIRCDDGTGDRTLNKGVIEFNTARYQETTISKLFSSWYSTLELVFTRVFCALEATLTITVLKGPPDFCGTITAWTTGNKDDHIILFNNEASSTREGGCFALSRVVSVPFDEHLVLCFSVGCNQIELTLEQGSKNCTCNIGTYEMQMLISVMCNVMNDLIEDHNKDLMYGA